VVRRDGAVLHGGEDKGDVHSGVVVLACSSRKAKGRLSVTA
jgi:hypothetical protein